MTDTEETAEGTFTAKQLARRLNTDPKTLRKFLRSKESPIEAVGQGGRYEFDEDAAKLIAKGFKSWGGVKPTKLKSTEEEIGEALSDDLEELEEIEDMEEPPAPKPKPRRSRGKKAPEPEPEPEGALEELADEPSPEELEELEDLDDLFEELED